MAFWIVTYYVDGEAREEFFKKDYDAYKFRSQHGGHVDWVLI